MNSKSDLKTIIESLNHCVDNHLMEIRLSVGALGLIGVGIALRSLRVATKFYDNNKIPKSFVKKNIRLRGVIRSVGTDGAINVEHCPIISMPWHRKSQNNERLLALSLSAINPNICAVYWLKLNVENKRILFRILSKNQNDINCIVSEEKSFLFNKSLNEELVERGLASVQPFDEVLDSIDSYKRLHKSLITSESKAKRKRSGIWYKPSKWDKICHQINYYFNSLINLRNVF